MKNYESFLAKCKNALKEIELIDAYGTMKYNVFYTLDIWNKEVILHSRFIADLLNPRGYHNKRILFLQQFIKILKKNISVDIDIESIKTVSCEESITNSRRLDIVIRDKSDNLIIIENKIFAYDQKEQLYDYSKTPCKGKILLLYLTINGEDPSEHSKKDLIRDVDYYCISYKDHIKNWLIESVEEIKKTHDNRLIITLTQYLDVVKYLSNSNNMENIMIILDKFSDENIEKKREDFNALLKISREINQLPIALAESFFKQLKELIINDVKIYSYSMNHITLDLNKNRWCRLDVDENIIRIGLSICNEAGYEEDLSKHADELKQFQDLINSKFRAYVNTDEPSISRNWACWQLKFNFNIDNPDFDIDTIQRRLSDNDEDIETFAKQVVAMYNNYNPKE